MDAVQIGAMTVIFAFVFLTGLCIGSFLNVVILRALSNESIVFPASKCPKCQTPLKWWHNIPVVSYICLRGKCAFCKEPISIQYPIIELVTGIIFTLMFVKFGFTLNTLFAWIISSLLIVIAGTDIREKVVFDIHTYSLIGVGLIYSILTFGLAMYEVHANGGNIEFTKSVIFNNPVTNSLLGILAGVVIMEVFARAGYLIASTRAFGEGDTYIAAGIGAFMGWKSLIWALILSVIVQVIMFLPIFVKGMVVNKEWKTFISFFAFVGYAILFYCLQVFAPFNAVLYVIGALILAALGISTCALIFKDLRENPQNRTYMPFGPAMVIAAFIMIIF